MSIVGNGIIVAKGDVMRSLTLLWMVMLILLGGLAQAETFVPGVTGYGIKGGFGNATIGSSVQEFDDEDSFAGGTFGAFMTYNISPSIAIQTELLFVAKGAGGWFLRGRSWRHDYLEIPVLVKYSLMPQKKLKPYLFIGPAGAYLLSAEFKSSFLGDTFDTGDAVKSTDFSIIFGGALEYRHFSFDVRYELGLVNVMDPDEWNTILDAGDPLDTYHMNSNDDIKNRYLAFTLCYRF